MLHWLFVDLNSYFASVEQQRRPKLRGKPVGVVPVMAETTCCISASYQAKRFGVKTGTLVAEARKLCPGIQFIEADHAVYVKYHEAIVEAVESCLPVASVMSIDEMACRLTGRDRETENAVALGREVKRKILKVGDQLTSSVGLATNRFLAKVASDMQKPDGLVTLQFVDLPRKLFSLKPKDLPGIGERMDARLARIGIRTMEQLYSLDMKQMRNIWGGVGGERFYRWMRGEDFDVEQGEHKTVGHSHVLPPEFRSPRAAYAVALRLLQKAAIRLRKIRYWASGLYLSIRYTDRTRWSQEVRMLECQDTLTLQEVLVSLWKQQPDPKKNPVKISITLLHLLSDHERTFSFFENRKRQNLSKAMDEINAKFGKNTIYLAGVHNVLTSAPTRIAFSTIPDLEV